MIQSQFYMHDEKLRELAELQKRKSTLFITYVAS